MDGLISILILDSVFESVPFGGPEGGYEGVWSWDFMLLSWDFCILVLSYGFNVGANAIL